MDSDSTKNKKIEQYNEKTEVDFATCDHKDAKVIGSELQCKCGAAYTGPRLNELVEALEIHN